MSTKPRQQPGAACDECRNRKLRCDRAIPCGVCKNLNVACTHNTTLKPRGPKRESLRALRNRLATVEERLLQYTGSVPSQPETLENIATGVADSSPGLPRQTNLASLDEVPPNQTYDFSHDMINSIPIPTMSPPVLHEESLDDAAAVSGLQLNPSDQNTTLPPPVQSELPAMFLPDVLQSPPTVAASGACTPSGDGFLQFPTNPLDVPISDVMRADLDLLYFERVHQFVPLFNRSRYYYRAAQAQTQVPTNSFKCLQYSMWTLATSMGTQFKHLETRLYTLTRLQLDCWDLEHRTGPVSIEYVQAWMLIALYELFQVNCQRGWITAGRCFRLVHLLKLHEIDNPTTRLPQGNVSWVETEEKRRLFWNAYCLDRYGNLSNQLPLTLSEEEILTRLPAPEEAFQRQQPTETKFLAQVMADNSAWDMPSFCGIIVLLTVSGRCISHQLKCNMERACEDLAMQPLARHQQLDRMLSQRSQIDQRHDHRDPGRCLDPISLFSDMVRQTTKILLFSTLCSLWSDKETRFEAFNSYQDRTILAVQRICSLAERLTCLGYFEVHPVTPILLYTCAFLCRQHQGRDPAFAPAFNVMVTALSRLGAVNNLARSCLQSLNTDNVEMTSLLNGT